MIIRWILAIFVVTSLSLALAAEEVDLRHQKIVDTLITEGYAAVDQAIPQLAQIISDDPNYLPAYLSLVDALQVRYQFGGGDKDNLAQAYKMLSAALQQSPDWAEAYQRRALVLLSLGDIVAGVADLEQAISLQPTTIDAWALKVEVLLVQQARSEAQAAAYDALSYQQDINNGARELSEVFFAAQEWEFALEFLGMLSGEASESAEVYFQKGFALESMDSREEAVRAYANAIQFDSTLRAPYLRLGVMLIENNDAARARQVLAQLLRESPEDVDALNLIAQAYVAEGQDLRARALWYHLSSVTGEAHYAEQAASVQAIEGMGG
jgi:tetratricopeptide (TPR) repeat protein